MNFSISKLRNVGWPLICALICCLCLSSCKQNPFEPCPDGKERIDLTLNVLDALFIADSEPSFVNVNIQWPTDCDQFPYRGELVVSIVDSTLIPGLKLFFRQNGAQTTRFVAPTEPPTAGNGDLLLGAVPDTVDGVALEPQLGSYSVTLRATFFAEFSDGEVVDQITEVEVSVEVAEGSIGISILSPQSGANLGDKDSIIIHLEVQDLSHGIGEVLYFVGSEARSYPYPNLPLAVEIVDTISLSSDGNKTIKVTAGNGIGESATKSVDFFVNGTGSELREVRWDGQGDGVNWMDKDNWAGNQIPTSRDRAIVDLPGTEQVIIQNLPGTFSINWNVGAIEVNADLIVQNGVKLYLTENEENSYVRGTARFQNLDPTSYESQILGFFSNTSNASLFFLDTLFLSDATFEARMNAGGNRVVVEGVAFDPVGSESGPSIVTLEGPVELVLSNITNTQGAFNWRFNLDGQGFGNPVIRNTGDWFMNGQTSFVYESFQGNAFIDNEGNISVLRIPTPDVTNNQWLIDGPIAFRSSGTWRDRSFEIEFPGTIRLNAFAPNANSFLTLTANSLNTDSDIIFSADDWTFTQSLNAAKVEIDHNGALGRVPSVDLSQATLDLDYLVAREGQFALGGGTITRVDLAGTGEINFEGNLTTDTLKLQDNNFAIACGQTVSTGLLEASRGVQNQSCATGILELRSNTHPAGSFIGPGNGTYRWNGTINLLDGAILQWLEGSFNSNQNTVFTLNIAENARFNINLPFASSWGYQSGNRFSQLNIENRGILTKLGQGNVQIRGCLRNIDQGSLVDQSNTLTIDDDGLSCN